MNVTKENDINLQLLQNEKKDLIIELNNTVKNNKKKEEEPLKIIQSQEFHIKQLNSYITRLNKENITKENNLLLEIKYFKNESETLTCK